MIAFPNCKINLGLNIIRKREDSYHNIETVFFPLNFTDVLEIISTEKREIEFTVTGLPISDNQPNLCLKAYDLLKKDFPKLPSVKMHLHKVVPIGAGLGGGSSDAAFTLKLLNEKFMLGISAEQLHNYALQLGSDCAFFLQAKTSFASGRGEILEYIDLGNFPYKILIVNPGISINTAWAYSSIEPSSPAKSIKQIITQPVETWKEELCNDFELPVFTTHPQIKMIKETLYKKGALYASLSGSGSTVYGIFDKEAIIPFEFPKGYFTRLVN